MTKKQLGFKNRGLVPTIQPEPDFLQKCDFCKVLDSVEVITYLEFQKTLGTGFRDIGNQHKKCPNNGFVSICDLTRFF